MGAFLLNFFIITIQSVFVIKILFTCYKSDPFKAHNSLCFLSHSKLYCHYVLCIATEESQNIFMSCKTSTLPIDNHSQSLVTTNTCHLSECVFLNIWYISESIWPFLTDLFYFAQCFNDLFHISLFDLYSWKTCQCIYHQFFSYQPKDHLYLWLL